MSPGLAGCSVGGLLDSNDIPQNAPGIETGYLMFDYCPSATAFFVNSEETRKPLVPRQSMHSHFGSTCPLALAEIMILGEKKTRKSVCVCLPVSS